MPTKEKKGAASGAAHGPSTAPSDFMLMCQLVDSGFNAVGYLFGVDVLPTMRVTHVQELIKIKKPNPMSHRNAGDLQLWMLEDPWPISGEDGGVSSINDLLHYFRDDPRSVARQLHTSSRVSECFKEGGPDDCLHLVVQVSISDADIVPHPVGRIDLARVNEYERVFARSKQWNFFTVEDIKPNGIEIATGCPGFVGEFKEMLSRKRGVNEHCRPSAQAGEFSVNYFNFSLSPDQPIASRAEVDHVMFLMSASDALTGLLGGIPSDVCRRAFKAPHANFLFFYHMTHYFQSEEGQTVVNQFEPVHPYLFRELTSDIRGSQWPFYLIVQVGRERRTYTPHSDFLVMKSLLPRLLVKVDSKSPDGTTRDLYHMLIQGACIVRFANSFIDAYSGDKFILVAVFIRDNGRADRYLLFQSQPQSQSQSLVLSSAPPSESLSLPSTSTDKVYYQVQSFELNDPADRVRFALEMYNLASALKRESVHRQTNAAVKAFRTTVHGYKESYDLTTFYSDAPKPKPKPKRKRGC